MSALDGKVAIVTGGAQGIGAAIAATSVSELVIGVGKPIRRPADSSGTNSVKVEPSPGTERT